MVDAFVQVRPYNLDKPLVQYPSNSSLDEFSPTKEDPKDQDYVPPNSPCGSSDSEQEENENDIER